MKNIKLISNWINLDPLWKLTPGCDGIWGNCNFNPDISQTDFDFVIILNCCPQKTVLSVPENHIWAIMQEPYIMGKQEYMMRGHDLYSKVFTHHLPSDDPKYITAPPYLPWFVEKTYGELKQCQIPEKVSDLSCVSSTKSIYPGHKKRIHFVKQLIKNSENLKCDVFGKGIRYVNDKWDALSPYRYSVAIENTSKTDYWTEKIADCFLSYTVPIYYGCTNIMEYFPENSYIFIDINEPQKSMQKIKEIISTDDWEQRLPALEQARNIVLDHHQFFPYMVKKINEEPINEKYTSVTIPKFEHYSLYNLSKYFYGKVKTIV